jgi:hypothetical protein
VLCCADCLLSCPPFPVHLSVNLSVYLSVYLCLLCCIVLHCCAVAPVQVVRRLAAVTNTHVEVDQSKLKGDKPEAAPARVEASVDAGPRLKIVLLSTGESGKSSEKETVKALLRSNAVWAIQTFIQKANEWKIPLAPQTAEKDIPRIPELKAPFNTDDICNVPPMQRRFSLLPTDFQLCPRSRVCSARAAEEVIGCMERVFADTGIAAVAARQSEYQLCANSPYVMKHLRRFGAANYVATFQDDLHTRIRTTGIVECNIPPNANHPRGGRTGELCIIDMGGERNERKKWIHCFEAVGLALWVVRLDAYDLSHA